MTEATFRNEGESVDYTAVAAISAGEVLQIPDGRAAVSPRPIAAGAKGAVAVCGIFEVAKTAGIVLLAGGRAFWDHSANSATFKPTADRDFYLGTVQADAASADTTVKVALNREQFNAIDLNRDPFRTVIVKTVVGSTTVEVPDVKARGGSHSLILGTTAEAQKVDLLSDRSFAVGSNAIVEGIVNVLTNGDAAAVDFNIGVASGTHPSDGDQIAEACFIHIDGASTNILAESDDNASGEVAAADTTIDFTAGTPFEFWMDFRNPADPQLYIDGVNVLPSSVFTLAAAAGPLKLLAHLEKSSDDSPGTFAVDRFVARLMQD